MEHPLNPSTTRRTPVRLLCAVLLALFLPLSATATAHASTPEQGEAAVAFAREQIGKPYVWGATGPDAWDASGLTQGAWREAGIEIPRTTYGQADLPHKVQRDELRPGDILVFYNGGHVALYTGEGRMVHASRPSRPIQELQLNDYWWSNLTSAVRPD